MWLVRCEGCCEGKKKEDSEGDVGGFMDNGCKLKFQRLRLKDVGLGISSPLLRRTSLLRIRNLLEMMCY